MQITREQFEELVAQALDGLPMEIGQYLDNIVVTIAEWPSPNELANTGHRSPYELLGLYQGIPLPHRGQGYNMALPDRVVIYRRPIQAIAHSPSAIRRRVERTVVHEIGHHFGIDDERLAEMGY